MTAADFHANLSSYNMERETVSTLPKRIMEAKMKTKPLQVTIDAERLEELEEKHNTLNRSLVALTTYCAQVQFRLRQILDAPDSQKGALLKNLEVFAFRGIPEINYGSSNATMETITNSEKHLPKKLGVQRAKQKNLMKQLKEQLNAYKRCATENTNTTQQTDNTTLSCHSADFNASNRHLVSEPNDLNKELKYKESLITQLKLQILDLEMYVTLLKRDRWPTANSSKYDWNVNCSKLKGVKPVHKESITDVVTGVVNRTFMLFWMFIETRFSKSSPLCNVLTDVKLTHWGDLRARLEISVINVLEIASTICNNLHNGGAPYLALAVRNHLAVSLRDLIHHGLQSTSDRLRHFLHLPCNCLHAWQLILLFYERKNGEMFNSLPARRLSESFDLDIESARALTAKEELLQVIGNIISMPMRNYDTYFKAFVCTALNSGRLVAWLRLIFMCRKLVDQHYQPWSYVVMTGFEDALESLDRLSRYKFDLPVTELFCCDDKINYDF